MADLEGLVLWGANNIFCLRSPTNETILARFKGKKLKQGEGEYNALVPGDLVRYEVTGTEGSILERLPRRNAMVRWNKKDGSPQAFAANLDQVVLVSSPLSPPFRPRFLDRCIVAADHQEIPVLIAMNKMDQGLPDEVEDRLAGYEALGYGIVLLSVSESRGLDRLTAVLKDRTSLLMGQSGVGKSSILKALDPQAEARIGEISEKFNRGRHTTVLTKTYQVEGLGTLIDSPGVREFEPAGIPSQALSHLFRDLAPLIPRCGRYNCTHMNEADCAILRAMDEGEVDPDRYEAYAKLYLALRDQERPYG